MTSLNWQCPYCLRDQTVTKAKFFSKFVGVEIQKSSLGPFGTITTVIGCANGECEKITLSVALCKAYQTSSGLLFPVDGEPWIYQARIIPDSSSKPQPDYIPAQLREDYLEACLIVDLSPKAAATLARRCLQGMIRDFAGIQEKTLYAEIISLKKAVDAGHAPRGVSIESVEAIDHLRTIGNIGAHMEADVEHIISVEPEEAHVLIELVESLFAEWYVERYTRAERFKAIAAIADAKNLRRPHHRRRSRCQRCRYILFSDRQTAVTVLS